VLPKGQGPEINETLFLSDESPVSSGSLNMKSRVDFSHFTCQQKESLGSNIEHTWDVSLRNTLDYDSFHEAQMRAWKALTYRQRNLQH